MKIECPSCHKAYDIPDERLPVGKRIAFACPGCKGRIMLDLRSNSGQGKESVPSEPHMKEQPSGEALANKILKSLDNLPPMPHVVFKAKEIMVDPDSSVRDLSRIIETDQSIVSKVLKLANSAYYGVRGKVSSIHHASTLLGLETLGEVVMMAGISGFLGKSMKGYQQEAGDLWQHSIAVAVCSRIIAGKKIPELKDNGYMAGLIHDIGKIVLDPYIFERKEEFEGLLGDEQQTFLNAEKQILGFDHAEIAFEICKKWNFPEDIAFAVRYHHHPSLAQGNELSYIVHVSDYIAMLSGIGYGSDSLLYQVEEDTMNFLSLNQEDISNILLEVIEAVQQITEEVQKT